MSWFHRLLAGRAPSFLIMYITNFNCIRLIWESYFLGNISSTKQFRWRSAYYSSRTEVSLMNVNFCVISHTAAHITLLKWPKRTLVLQTVPWSSPGETCWGGQAGFLCWHVGTSVWTRTWLTHTPGPMIGTWMVVIESGL